MILILPQPLLLFHVVLLHARVFDVGSSVAHDIDQAEDKTSLAYRECHGLHQIPSEPRHVENGVVAEQELSREKAGHQGDLKSVSGPVSFLNLVFLLLQLQELSYCNCFHCAQLEDLLADDWILEELCLLNILIADFAYADLAAAWRLFLSFLLFICTNFCILFCKYYRVSCIN